jgi:hypothetical protein
VDEIVGEMDTRSGSEESRLIKWRNHWKLGSSENTGTNAVTRRGEAVVALTEQAKARLRLRDGPKSALALGARCVSKEREG